MSHHSRHWQGLLWLLLALWILAVSWCGLDAGQIPAGPLRPGGSPPARNFLHDDPELRQVAEAARVRSAEFWSGRALPGDWYAPCPIVWESRRGAGSGLTRFAIDRGEVYGWEMRLQGAREAVLADVLPHEVDHAVRATLVRRPLPRWLDEGCSTLFESAEVHAQLRAQRREEPRALTMADLDRLEYPRDPAANQALYAAGFSLVEYLLLRRGTPAELLAVQRSPEPPSRSLATAFRQPAPELLEDWRDWETQRLELGLHCDLGCPCHAPPGWRPGGNGPPRDRRPELHVWTSATCVPCQRFHADLQGPLAELRQRYQVILHDLHHERTAAGRAGVSRVPTFFIGDRRIEEYHGPEPLLVALGLRSPPVVPEATSAPAPPVPAKSGPPAVSQESPAAIDPPPPPHVVPQESPSGSAPPVVAVAPPVVSEGWGSRWLTWGLSGWSLGLAIAAAAGTGGLLTPAVVRPAIRFAVGTMRGLRRITSPEPPEAPPFAPPALAPGSEVRVSAPFPRVLDEARELLALRQQEGRVAALDALRGMALDDAAQVILDSDQTPAAEKAAVRRLLAVIDHQVDAIAPISTRSGRLP